MDEAVLAVLGARGEASVGTVIDGLAYLVSKARRGDREARAALKQLREQLRAIDEVLGVVIPGGN